MEFFWRLCWRSAGGSAEVLLEDLLEVLLEFFWSFDHRDKRWGDCATLEAVINFFSPKAMKLRIWGFFKALNSIVLLIFLKNLCKSTFRALFSKILAKS